MADLLDSLKAALADRYRLGRELGSGGMATVYLAEGKNTVHVKPPLGRARDSLANSAHTAPEGGPRAEHGDPENSRFPRRSHTVRRTTH